MKLTPPESEPDAAVPVIIEEENATKPRKSSMHHSSPSSAGPVTDKLVTPAQAAFRKRSVTFNPMSSFEVHEEKAEDDADGGDEAEKEDFQSVKLEDEDEDEEDAVKITARPPTPPRGRKKTDISK